MDYLEWLKAEPPNENDAMWWWRMVIMMTDDENDDDGVNGDNDDGDDKNHCHPTTVPMLIFPLSGSCWRHRFVNKKKLWKFSIPIIFEVVGGARVLWRRSLLWKTPRKTLTFVCLRNEVKGSLCPKNWVLFFTKYQNQKIVNFDIILSAGSSPSTQQPFLSRSVASWGVVPGAVFLHPQIRLRKWTNPGLGFISL